MQVIRQMALGVCLLCAAAGMIRIFWPDNRFKPVINTVLLLYILTSVLQTGAGADWDAAAAEISRFTPDLADTIDLKDYEEQLARQVSAQALESILQQNGIAAAFDWEDDTLCITLADASQLDRTRELLEENSGTLPFRLETEGGNR